MRDTDIYLPNLSLFISDRFEKYSGGGLILNAKGKEFISELIASAPNKSNGKFRNVNRSIIKQINTLVRPNKKMEPEEYCDSLHKLYEAVDNDFENTHKLIFKTEELKKSIIERILNITNHILHTAKTQYVTDGSYCFEGLEDKYRIYDEETGSTIATVDWR